MFGFLATRAKRTLDEMTQQARTKQFRSPSADRQKIRGPFRLRRLLLYGIVGLMGTAVQYAILVALVEFGLVTHPAAASSAGAVAGAVINYFLNYYLTFQATSRHKATLPKFTIIAAVGLAVNGALMALLTAIGIQYLAAQIIATACVFLSTFTLNSFWTFNGDGRKSCPCERL